MCAACCVLCSAGSGVPVCLWCTPFSRRGSECGRVTAQRSVCQTPSLRGHDRTLPYPKPSPESLASGGPEAPLAPPPRCCRSKRNLLRLCPESGSLKLCPLVSGCDALRVARYWCLEIPTSHSEDSWSSCKSLALPFFPDSPKLRGADSQNHLGQSQNCLEHDWSGSTTQQSVERPQISCDD